MGEVRSQSGWTDNSGGNGPIGPPHPITNYTIVAVLHTDSHIVAGQTTINYVNHAGVTLNQLVFHLYPNAFRRKGGWITVGEVRYAGSNLTYTISGDDLTVLTVDISSPPGPGPLSPGGNITLTLLYQVQVPNIRDRFGWFYTTSPCEMLAYNMGNWHPIVSVYDDRGWHKAPYTFMGESFYSEVATYDVALTVPEDYVVAATGELESVTPVSGGRKTWHWTTGPVRDFTWCASPHYRTSSILCDGVNVTSYYAEGHLNGGQQVLQVAHHCLRIYGSLFGPYPWESLRIVEVDFWAGGMEYPQLVMIDTGLYDYYEERSWLEYVTAHEIGHEWVPFSIGTDSNAEPWIDEGFASYCELCFAEYVYGPEERAIWRTHAENGYWSFFFTHGDESINQSIPYWESHSGYVYIVYDKACLVYDMLRHQLGNQTFYQAWHHVYQQALHRNIRAKDLQALFEEAVGYSLDWFFDPWVYGSGVPTLSLSGATAQPGPAGWTLTFQIIQEQEDPIALNVPILVSTTTGSQIIWVWMEAASVTTHTVQLAGMPVTLLLDPEHVILRWGGTEGTTVACLPYSVTTILVIGGTLIAITAIAITLWWYLHIKAKTKSI